MFAEKPDAARAELGRVTRGVFLLCHEAHLLRGLLSGKPGTGQWPQAPPQQVHWILHMTINLTLPRFSAVATLALTISCTMAQDPVQAQEGNSMLPKYFDGMTLLE